MVFGRLLLLVDRRRAIRSTTAAITGIAGIAWPEDDDRFGVVQLYSWPQ
jgi:hypothetical protein